MGFRNISAWAIRNPVPPLVLFLALTIAGIISFMRMDVNRDPDIDIPIVVVVISQPGAAPKQRRGEVKPWARHRHSCSRHPSSERPTRSRCRARL